MKKYTLTETDRAALPGWRERWIANAMSTAAMTEEDRDICRDAVRRLYRAAALEPPPNERIVFVPSPFVLRYAGGFALWVWRDRANRSVSPAPLPPASPTSDSHEALAEWWVAPPVALMAAMCGLGPEAAQSAFQIGELWHGGNQTSGADCFLSFFRHVAKLPLDYTHWDAWETLSLHSGPRIVHEKFCMISDRPELLLVDEENRPHAVDGPFCRWRDGTALYSWHGVRIPAIWIEDRTSLTAATALAVESAEQRRAACEIVGWDRILEDLNARTLDKDEDPEVGELVEVDLPGSGSERFLRVVCGTGRRFALPVPPNVQTALEANAWTYGLTASDYNPEFRT